MSALLAGTVRSGTTFAPRLDLTTARVVGFVGSGADGVDLRPGRSSDDGVETYEDRLDRAVASVLAAARAAGTSPVTVHLPVPADVVAHVPHRLRALRPAMLHGAGRGGGVTLLLTARRRSASAAALERGIAQVRRDGFAVALPACGFAPIEIARLAPDELVLRDECLLGLEDGDPAALATRDAAATLARAAGLVLVADGVRDEAQLRDLRARGVVAASGPLIAADQTGALPAEVVLAPALRTRLRDTAPAEAALDAPTPVPPDRPVTLADVARPATVVPDAVTGDEIRAVFADDPDCAGVVLVDATGSATGYVDRNRFLLTIAGPYGRAVYAHRTAGRLAEAPRVRPTTMPAREAVRDQLDGDPARRYDDTVLVEPDGRTVRVARFSDLVRALDPAAAGPPTGPATGLAAGAATRAAEPAGEVVRRGRHRLVGLRARPIVSS